MAHNLKLNIWSIRFEEKIGNEYSVIDIKKLFSIFLDNPELDKKEIFKNFVKKYIASFNDQFVNDEDETKAFTYEDIKFDSGKNIIYGRIKGGLTGIEQDVYVRDSKEPTNKKIHKELLASKRGFSDSDLLQIKVGQSFQFLSKIQGRTICQSLTQTA